MFALVASAAAHAQSWKATTELVASSPSSCPRASLVYEFSVEGSRLKGTTPNGKPIDSPIGADGAIVIDYQGSPQVGAVQITGNASTRQLESTASALRGCRYALVAAAAAAPSGMAPTGADWALGRWDGTVYMTGTSAGSMGLRSERRSLIVRKNADGTSTCNWAEPEHVQKTPARSCRIGTDTVSLVTVASSIVELTRSGPDDLTGRFQATGWARAQAHLQRAR